MKVKLTEEPESVSNHPFIINLNIAVNIKLLPDIFQRMPHKDTTSNMTPPGAAETRGRQEVDVFEEKTRTRTFGKT